MKVVVVKQEPKFEPITITLEDKDEAAAFWHILNQEPIDYREKYFKRYGVKGNYIQAIGWELFKAINPIIGEYASKLKVDNVEP